MSFAPPSIGLSVSILLVCLLPASLDAQQLIRLTERIEQEIPSTSAALAKPVVSKDDVEDANTQLLRQKGIEPTFDGIKKYLQAIHISEEQKNQAAELIKLLGSEDYQVRQEATKKLSRFPGLPIEEFERAKKTSDPETSYRIEMVARFLNSSFGKTLGAAYRVIADRGITGLMPEIIRSKIFTTDNEALNSALLDAVIATATPKDDQQLRALLSEDSTKIQAAAVEGLYRSQKDAIRPLLGELATKEGLDDYVRFKAVEALADLGDRSSLKSLISLLNSDNVNVRTWAGNVLQTATGVDQGYTGYAKEEVRRESIKKWESWLAENGETVELRFPLKKFIQFASYLNGNTLLACGYKDQVIELNPEGKEVWSVAAKGAWSAEKLKNGNVLVACYNQNKVVEYDLKKNEVWVYNCKSPLNARPLKNGNVLVSEYSGRRVIEVNRRKEIVWSFDAEASVADAVRMASGNTLVAAQSRIVEVDMKGKVVWEYPTNQPYGVQALKNGNILVAKFTPGQVLEINRKKEIVWQYDCKNPTDAMMLPNGNFLVTENTRFIEVTRDKKVIWSKTGASCGAARR